MTKTEALKLIDDHKNKLTDPEDLLHWTWLRVIITRIPEDSWEAYLGDAIQVLAR